MKKQDMTFVQISDAEPLFALFNSPIGAGVAGEQLSLSP